MESSQSREKESGKLWRRLKRIFKSKKPATTSTSSTRPVATTAPVVIPSSPAPPSPKAQKDEVPEPVTSTKPQQTINDQYIEPDSEEQDSEQTIPPITRAAIPTAEQSEGTKESDARFRKAQALFAKYDLDLKEQDWDMRPKVPHERVPKNIRMRVRYTCHNCQTSFGHDKTCISCQHQRCAKCTRYPPKKDRKKRLAEPSAIPQPLSEENSQNCTCHECQTGFDKSAEECPNCHHKVCERCLQETVVTVEPTTTIQT